MQKPRVPFLQRLWYFMCNVPLVPAYTVVAIIFLLSMTALFVPIIVRQQVAAAVSRTATAMAHVPTPIPTPAWTLVSPFPTQPVPTPLLEGQSQGTPAQPSALTQAPVPSPVASATVQPVPTSSPVQPTVSTQSPGQPTATTQVPAPQSSPTPQVVYNFDSAGGTLVTNPPLNWCDPPHGCVSTFWTDTNGYVVQCTDGKYSHSGGVQGACSSNGGVKSVLYAHTG